MTDRFYFSLPLFIPCSSDFLPHVSGLEASLVAQLVKNLSACNVRDLGSIPGLEKNPWRREWHPTPVFLPGESHGQRSLVGYSPWHHKEEDTTEQLTFSGLEAFISRVV